MENINRFIEQTNLKPTLTYQDIEILIKEAKVYQFGGVCVPPFWVKKVSRDLKEEDIQIVTVIGFPLGYTTTEAKMEEARQALNDGATELDLVVNISAFKSGMPWVKIEIAKLATLAHEQQALLKVIIETAYLNDEEIKMLSLLCQEAGADFVKTSTGFAGQGAKVENIRLMRETLSSNVGIKASGGIKNLQQAKDMIEAGADRIGTSSGVEIVKAVRSK
ncbi:deoxyribose-phosphate aldolase [Xanthovirga aplysinae]|uniref:deoxyribose-phosphate aldolase n=1 Tax=Xanthovirga aplysinae TaxID=2529853 RepID=UPI0012BCF7EE|nr:deoxyribose-phosphate aldolase [Xanthovirga aplysinae]MTI29697.1 deoxyribose-phosphate aldolase [Xanthovirga aplysinae]